MTNENQGQDPTQDSGQKRGEVDKTVLSSNPQASKESPRTQPDEIGGYKILGVLGEGGMGVVYEAEQPSPRRLVALKVVRGVELVDDMRLKMFEREAATLARLDHPNIGRIYESGRTNEGRHFFAMELVRGSVLSAWLAKRPTNIDRNEIEIRLQLFRQICDAVHYAHQRGVIHRDLKPSNLIVTDAPSSGVSSDIVPTAMVKILDFGLARITEEDVAATQVTEIGVIKGTLPYMAPEQARGEVDSIDVRTDVYALGVILYELLTGQRPYTLDTGTLLSAVRIICEQTPRPLSEVWKGTVKLDPDLVTITATALEKDADRRYASAAALSEDIGRFLTSQPIQARPPSTMYQLKKLVSRRKGLFATAATALVLLIVAAIAMAGLWVRSEANLTRALEAEKSARLEAATAKRTSEFVVGLFQSSDPKRNRGGNITAREVVDEGAARLEKELVNEPVMQARLMHTIGSVYSSLGLFAKADTLARKSLAIREQNLPAGDIDIASGHFLQAEIWQREGKNEQAKNEYGVALKMFEALGPAGNDGVIDVLGNLAWLLGQMGELKQADSTLDRALTLVNLKQPLDVTRLLGLLNNQSTIKMDMGKTDSALQILDRALSLSIKLHGDTSSATAGIYTNMGVANSRAGHFDMASENELKALGIYRTIYGEAHPEVAKALGNVGIYFAQQQKFSEARPYFEEALVSLTKIHGPDHPDVGTGYTNLGLMKLQSGDPKGAIDDLLKSVSIHEKANGPINPPLAIALYHLASARDELGDHAEALRLIKRVVSIDESIYGPESGAVSDDLEAVAAIEHALGHDAEAKIAEERTKRIRESLKGAEAVQTPQDTSVSK